MLKINIKHIVHITRMLLQPTNSLTNNNDNNNNKNNNNLIYIVPACRMTSEALSLGETRIVH